MTAGFEEWRDHIPSGYEDMTGYGQVSCSCGWDSGGKLGWIAHIDAAQRTGKMAADGSDDPEFGHLVALDIHPGRGGRDDG